MIQISISVFIILISSTCFAGEMKSQVVNPATNPWPDGKPGEDTNTSRVPIGTSGAQQTTRKTPPAPAKEKEPDPEESNALKEAMGQMLNAVTGAMGGGPGGSSEFAGSGDTYSGSNSGYTGGNPVGGSELSGSQKIVSTFQRWFKYCTGDRGLGECKFQNMGIEGDSSHRTRKSCHNSGEAIDIGNVTCGGRSISPKSDEYFNLAICMANQTQNQLQVIFYRAQGPNMIQKSDHADHMHIQLKNCAMVYGR